MVAHSIHPAWFAVLLAAPLEEARAFDVKVAGRLTAGSVVRTERQDPRLLVAVNGAELGQAALAPAGQNSDDANNNYARGDTVSRALKGYLDVTASAGTASARLVVKGWHDDGLRHDGRPWGHAPNGFVAGAPLSDAGAARGGRFSGVALGEAWVQDSVALGRWRLAGRVGRQSLNWGERAATGSGLAAVNVVDLPALRRAGATPLEFRVPQPMLFARLAQGPVGFAVEGFWQRSFQPGAADLCGTFWAPTDYLAGGCNVTFAGPPPASDRQRIRSGSFLKRVPGPDPHERQYGLALTWKGADGLELGLYGARIVSRTLIPGLRKSLRPNGPALIAGDPDGRNLAFFAAHAGGVEMVGLTVLRQRPGLALYGELVVRPDQPVQLSPADVLAAFLNPATPALLRADTTRVAPGGYFHAFDRYRTAQLLLNVQKELGRHGGAALSGSVELVYKRAFDLLDPAVRRYGRPDVFGPGPVFGVCSGTGPTAAVQCGLDGYVTPGAWGYRLKLDARFGKVAPGLDLSGDLTFGHEVRGWSHDLQINQGRKTATIALRADYRERYLLQLSYSPIWGGTYNNLADRDQAAVMAGVRF